MIERDRTVVENGLAKLPKACQPTSAASSSAKTSWGRLAKPRLVGDRWVHQVERANLRMAILRALEEPAKGRGEIERGTA